MFGELAASIAHEVNQPLAAISANAAASLRWLSRDEPVVTKAIELSSRIGADAQRAADVVGRIRAMAAKRDAVSEPVAVRPLVDETLVALRDELQARHAHVTTPIEPLTALGDRTQLQQVLVNLIMNAVQGAAPHSASIRIGATRQADALVLTVADDGPGLEGDPDGYFTSFYSTKADGLGLPICRSIIEAHGGRIGARNAPDGGAVFTIHLPAEEPHTKV